MGAGQGQIEGFADDPETVVPVNLGDWRVAVSWASMGAERPKRLIDVIKGGMVLVRA